MEQPGSRGHLTRSRGLPKRPAEEQARPCSGTVLAVKRGGMDEP